MDTWVWTVIGVFVAVVVIGILVSALGTRRSRSLQDRFGSEYDRTVDKAGGRREAVLEVDDEADHADQASNRDLTDVHAHDNVERLR